MVPKEVFDRYMRLHRGGLLVGCATGALLGVCLAQITAYFLLGHGYLIIVLPTGMLALIGLFVWIRTWIEHRRLIDEWGKD